MESICVIQYASGATKTFQKCEGLVSIFVQYLASITSVSSKATNNYIISSISIVKMSK